ncbi:hypothetical protein like AT3G21320 [Hibiscus trionum]|uniref:Uncharacterized protein n=1 Tax=Hibiscus trionum TaxID=183268 RepID=A0A9W7H8S0_HIBTR|nr:hypothetical protein like AT3G21320 [Hibiscus trionum]
MMTRGGEDEAKVMISPLFPRLHVSESDKGGGKAPPRNKMALYEHLNIPSQRFNSGSLSTLLPLRPNNNNNSSVPSTSSSHGGGDESSMFMPFYNGLDTAPAIPQVSKSNPLQSLQFSNYKKFSSRKLGFNDDLMVPTHILSGIDKSFSCSQQSKGPESFSKSNLDASVQLQIANRKNVKESDSVDSNSGRYVMNRGEENGRLLRSHRDLMERPNSIPSTICSSVDLLNGGDGSNAQLHNEHMAAQGDTIFREYISVGSGRCLENASKVGNESCLRESLGVDNGCSNMLENKSKPLEEKKSGTWHVGTVGRNKNARDASMVKSISLLDICPDDVIGIIGEKHFREVRRDIVNHQRVFALQVFELHRLIKVQKLIARSPHMVLEDTLNMAKQSSDVSSIKKLSPNYVLEPPLFLKDNSHKPSISIKRADDDAVAKLPLPFAIDDTNKGQGKHRPRDVPFSGNPLSTSMDANTSPSQWLVPIMSHSEGLVYKPYTGPCPPTVGFLAPIYGNCSDSSQHGIGNPPLGPAYFLHYGMPVSNPSVSSLAVEQISSFNGFRSKGNQFSTSDVNFTISGQSSCSVSSQMSQAISYCARKLPELIENETQASVASSPSKRAKRDALPLFPTEPTMPTANRDAPPISASRGQAIKVVPHNPISATESAARIFQSIQEERKQYK